MCALLLGFFLGQISSQFHIYLEVYFVESVVHAYIFFNNYILAVYSKM